MRDDIRLNSGVSDLEKEMKYQFLTVQGAKLSDLCLSFVVPGTTLEIVKNGSRIEVSLENLDEYI